MRETLKEAGKDGQHFDGLGLARQSRLSTEAGRGIVIDGSLTL